VVGAGPDERVWVIFANDDVTSMGFVVEQLRERFGCTQARASHLMYSVHFHGHAVVAEGEYGEMRERVELVKGAAREAGFPFLARIVPPHGGRRG
jgi:ATP-dependent Clp protease adapter protein ClpS